MNHIKIGSSSSTISDSSFVPFDNATQAAVTAAPGRVESHSTPSCNTGVKSSSIYSSLSPILVNCGIDYIRLTCKDKDVATKLAFVALHLRNDYIEAGNKVESCGFFGYRGYKVGSLFYGERHDSIMLQISGEDAGSIWRDIAPLAAHINITRLDLQATVQQELAHDYFRNVADGSASASAAAAERGRPWNVRLVDGYGDGDTVYIGSRKSAHYGRVYDKYKESLGRYPAGSVRCEVEYKDEYATAMFVELAKVGSSLSAVEQVAHSHVVAWFARRGVAVPVAAAAVDPVSVPAAPSDDERSLTWLDKQVKPTVERLVAAGKEDATLQALGFAASAAVASPKVKDGLQAVVERITEKYTAVLPAELRELTRLHRASVPSAFLMSEADRQLAQIRVNGFIASECDDWLSYRRGSL